MRSVSGLILAWLGAVGMAAAEGTAGPVDVHFTSRATVVDGGAIKAAAKARQSEAARKAKELEQAYKAEYGKDQGKWPREKRAELSALRIEARDDGGAAVEADYASAPLEDLADSARDLANGAGAFGGGLLRVVGNADLADLVVEVTGRHSSKSEYWLAFDDQFGFILRLSAGGKLAEGRLRGAVVRWPGDEEQDIVVVNELHGYRDDEPYWLLQVQGSSSWTALANRTDGILADFVRANANLIVGKGSAGP